MPPWGGLFKSRLRHDLDRRSPGQAVFLAVYLVGGSAGFVPRVWQTSRDVPQRRRGRLLGVQPGSWRNHCCGPEFPLLLPQARVAAGGRRWDVRRRRARGHDRPERAPQRRPRRVRPDRINADSVEHRRTSYETPLEPLALRAHPGQHRFVRLRRGRRDHFHQRD